MNSILTLSSIIFPIITFPYVSRILLAEGTGKVAFATSVITYFSMFAQLGIPTYGIRACAKVRDEKEELSKTVHELFIINLFMSIITYIVLFTMMAVVPKLAEEKTLLLIISSSILFNVFGVEWLYKGLEQYSYITIRSVLFKFIALIAMFLLVTSKSDYIIYGAISIFAGVGSNLLNLFNLRKFITLHKFKDYNFKQHFGPMSIFFAMTVATTIYTNLNTVILGFVKTATDVGYYSAAIKIKSILVSFVGSLGTVILPRVSYYVQNNMKEQFLSITQKATNFILAISFPLTIYFILYSKESILFIAGSDFVGSVIPMQVMMPTIIFIGLTNILGIQILVPLGREKQVLYSVIVGAIIDLILLVPLIGKFGVVGAAIATLGAEIGVFIYQAWVLKDIFLKNLNYKNVSKILFSVCIAGFISLLVLLMDMPIFYTLALSFTIFCLIYAILLLLLKETFLYSVIFKNYRRKKGTNNS
jgi:O-antigen/teichoic acid export membrane protein